jgi:hypothetical protein
MANNKTLDDVVVELQKQNRILSTEPSRQEVRTQQVPERDKEVEQGLKSQNVILLDMFRLQKNRSVEQKKLEKAESDISLDTKTNLEGISDMMKNQLKTLNNMLNFDKKKADDEKREKQITSVEKSGPGGASILGGAITASIFFLFKKSVDSFKSTIEDLKKLLGMSNREGSFFDRLFAPVIAPLKSLGIFLLKGFKIGGLFYILFQIFKDIGQNEQFINLISSIGSFWKEGVVPLFNSLKSFFFTISEETSPLMKLFNDARLIIQDIVLGFGVFVFDILGGLFKTVSQLLDGDFLGVIQTFNDTFMGALSNVFNTVVNTIVDTIDSLVSFVLRLFGVNFFEGEGSLFKWFDAKVYAFVDSIKAAWNAFERGWNAVIDFFWGTERNTDEGGLDTMVREGGLINLVWSRVTAVIDWVKLYFTNPVEALTQLWNSVFGEGGLVDILFIPINAFYNWISKKLEWSDEDAPDISIRDIIHDWAESLKEWVREIFSFLPSISDITESLYESLPSWLQGVVRKTAGFITLEDSEPGVEQRTPEQIMNEIQQLEERRDSRWLERNRISDQQEIDRLNQELESVLDEHNRLSGIIDSAREVVSVGAERAREAGAATREVVSVGAERDREAGAATEDFILQSMERLTEGEETLHRILDDISEMASNILSPIIITNTPVSAPITNNIRGGTSINSQNSTNINGVSSGMGRFAN